MTLEIVGPVPVSANTIFKVSDNSYLALWLVIVGLFMLFVIALIVCAISTFEPSHEKTNILYMRIQRRRSASQ